MGAAAVLVPLIAQMNPGRLDPCGRRPGRSRCQQDRARPAGGGSLARTADLRVPPHAAELEDLAGPETARAPRRSEFLSRCSSRPMRPTGIARSSRNSASWSASARISAAFRCSIRSPTHRRRPPTGRAATSVPATARNTIAAGRVFSGVPAPYNLPVPPYPFVSDATVRIGENPSGSSWDFGSIRQL